MLLGFTKGISVDVSYLLINDVLEYNPPYVQSDFMCDPGPTMNYMLRCSLSSFWMVWARNIFEAVLGQAQWIGPPFAARVQIPSPSFTFFHHTIDVCIFQWIAKNETWKKTKRVLGLPEYLKSVLWQQHCSLQPNGTSAHSPIFLTTK